MTIKIAIPPDLLGKTNPTTKSLKSPKHHLTKNVTLLCSTRGRGWLLDRGGVRFAGQKLEKIANTAKTPETNTTSNIAAPRKHAVFERIPIFHKIFELIWLVKKISQKCGQGILKTNC